MKNKWIYLSGALVALTLPAGFRAATQAPPRAPQPSQAPTRTRPAESRIPGMLDSQSDDTITAPATVAANQDFRATIITTGGGCEREGDASVVLSENSASVMVYDFTTANRPGVACTMILKRFSHTVNLRFSKPGEAIIYAWGRQTGPTTSPFGAPVVLEKRILVR